MVAVQKHSAQPCGADGAPLLGRQKGRDAGWLVQGGSWCTPGLAGPAASGPQCCAPHLPPLLIWACPLRELTDLVGARAAFAPSMWRGGCGQVGPGWFGGLRLNLAGAAVSHALHYLGQPSSASSASATHAPCRCLQCSDCSFVQCGSGQRQHANTHCCRGHNCALQYLSHGGKDNEARACCMLGAPSSGACSAAGWWQLSLGWFPGPGQGRG